MLKHAFYVCLVSLVISGCGGDSGGSSASTPTPSPVTPPPSADQFAPSIDNQAYCAVPRTAINPATGQLAYPDVAGSIEQENLWLRSWSNELYLWYDEIVYQDPALFNDPVEYFDTLRTIAVTPSGANRDNYHFTYETEEWEQLSQSGVSSGYGARYAIQYPSNSAQVFIAYVEPNSPAELAGLVRGTLITNVDGASIPGSSTNIINAGLFPETIGESHNFIVSFPGSSTTTAVSMTSANVVTSPVLSTLTLPTASGDVGYLLFNRHIATAEEQLANAINTLDNANITDLVLDLRYNGGGYLDIASQLAYMIAGPTKTTNRTFEKLTFNDQHPTIDPVTLQSLQPVPFHDTTIGLSLASGQDLPTLDLDRVFILTGPSTCSASESIINSLPQRSQ